MSVFGIGSIYFIFHSVFNWWIILLVGTSLFWTAVLVTAPLHLQYLIENWSTRLYIDNEAQIVTIENESGSFTYTFQETKTERHLGGHHKPGMIKSFTPVPFDYYGYVKIQTRDGKSFYITSLMTDPFDFPLPISETRYWLPFINKSEHTLADTQKQKIDEYIERFSSLSNDTLLKKVSNTKRYEIEAVKAAEYLLRERQKINPVDNTHNQERGSL
jgi:hypothetical protein